jgi:dephospho-CoA kinase
VPAAREPASGLRSSQRRGAPRFIGLTGGIAAGKSEALAALERLGAATISSDDVVHELLGTDEMRDLLVERWGGEVAPNGALDRERVGRIVFERPEELRWLEAELHPRVGRRILAWRQSLPDDAQVAVVEVPLLFESGMEGLFDAVVSVVTPDAERERRIAARGVGSAAEGSGRQLSQEEKAARATYVVRNDGTRAELEARLAELMSELEERSNGDPR